MKVAIVLPKIIAMSFAAVLGFQSAPMAHITNTEMPYHMKLMPDQKTAQPEEAVTFWEQAIAAKGGRERLHSVLNMVISTHGKYGSRQLGENQVRGETLFVFPARYWDWSDYRPDVFGLRISMYNFETQKKYIISDGEPQRQIESITAAEQSRAEMHSLLPYLLETKWLRPVVVGVKTGRIRLRPVNIVQTTVNGKRVDFALDQKSHLPVRVSYHDLIKGKEYITALDLSDYVDIDGIKVPQKIKYDDGTEYKQAYQFNVEYNEDIFVRPTTIQAGPQAWKPKT